MRNYRGLDSLLASDTVMLIELYEFALKHKYEQLIVAIHEFLEDRGEKDQMKKVFCSTPFFDFHPAIENEFLSLFKDDETRKFAEAVNSAVLTFFNVLPLNPSIETMMMMGFRTNWRDDPSKAMLFSKIKNYFQKYKVEYLKAFDRMVEVFCDTYLGLQSQK